MFSKLHLVLIGLQIILFQADSILVQTGGGPRPAVTIDQQCATCHGNPNVERAPDLGTLRKMNPERIYKALTTGSMSGVAAGISDQLKREIAEYLSERKLGVAGEDDAVVAPNRCLTNPPIRLEATPAWNGWGVDLGNTRFQSADAAKLTPAQIMRLKVKWAFAFPGATAMYGQPTIAGGRVFAGANTGYVYALDAATGCVYWSFQAHAGVRTAISVGPLKGQPSRLGVYFGDMRGYVYGVDSATGELLWQILADDHGIARITGSPTLYQNRLYVPVASMEEGGAASLNYPCCTFRGSVLALDADSGKQLWKTYTIPDVPKPTRKNSNGIQQWAPAGGAVWGAPTIDVQRRAVYVSTGNAYTSPAPSTTDAVMAFNLETGKVLWSVQDIEKDAWIAGCGPFADPAVMPSENCPSNIGPDYDFSSSVILKTLTNGRRVLIAGQKSGIVWAHDPDHNGALLWKTNVARKPPDARGELVWGGAADQRKAYFGMYSGGVVALSLDGGARAWFTPLEPVGGRPSGNSAAVTALSEVVLASGWDGVVRALSADTGTLLWQYDTVREFQAVNSVTARGGSIGAQGVTVAGGMLFATSGYVGFQNGLSGNVLIAFSPE